MLHSITTLAVMYYSYYRTKICSCIQMTDNKILFRSTKAFNKSFIPATSLSVYTHHKYTCEITLNSHGHVKLVDGGPLMV